MPRDVCAISEYLSPCAAAYAYDAPGRRLYGYDDGDNLSPAHVGKHLNKGRYISSDPIGLADGLNTFGYILDKGDLCMLVQAYPRIGALKAVSEDVHQGH